MEQDHVTYSRPPKDDTEREDGTKQWKIDTTRIVILQDGQESHNGRFKDGAYDKAGDGTAGMDAGDI